MPIQNDFNDFMVTTALARQLRTSANSAQPALPISENHFFYESVFLRVFRAYENYLERIFISYTQQEPTLAGVGVLSFVTPSDKDHARKLITSSMPFLDWTSPQNVISRAEVYLQNGGPIKLATSTNQAFLVQTKKIRNHISHNSEESQIPYLKVLNELLLTTPIVIPTPGELLSMVPTKGPSKNVEILEYYIKKFESLAHALAH